jgi:hypothetical protein
MPFFALVLRLYRQHLLKPPHKPLFCIDKLCRDKPVHNLEGQRRPNNPRSQHADVHIVVLHALVRGVGVVAHPGANPRYLVGRHAHSNSRAANQNPARRLALLQRQTHLLGKVGIVVGVVAAISSQVHHLVAGLGEIGADFLLQRKSRMVRCNHEFQNALLGN